MFTVSLPQPPVTQKPALNKSWDVKSDAAQVLLPWTILEENARSSASPIDRIWVNWWYARSDSSTVTVHCLDHLPASVIQYRFPSGMPGLDKLLLLERQGKQHIPIADPYGGSPSLWEFRRRDALRV
jgi:hypothetical protein